MTAFGIFAIIVNLTAFLSYILFIQTDIALFYWISYVGRAIGPPLCACYTLAYAHKTNKTQQTGNDSEKEEDDNQTSDDSL